MKIAVINGSPKGKFSVTVQTIRYLQLKNPEHEFQILNAGQMIKALEKDFSRAREIIDQCDAVLFSYPVYTFLAPSQLHRFIELLWSEGVDMKGKFVSQITTSKHFYDVTAHRFIEENMLDMGARVIRGLSADMDDLLTEKGQNEADKFFERFVWSKENGVYTEGEIKKYITNRVPTQIPEVEIEHVEGKDVLIVTDCSIGSNLEAMIERFRANFKYKTRVINLNDVKINAGCLGCMHCVSSAKCVHKDGFDEFLRTKIHSADAIVYACEIKNHSFGTRFKLYDDRNFCNGHRPVSVGMPIAFLISGNYSEEGNVRTLAEARAEVGGNYLAGVATDEFNPNEEIDKLCKSLAFALDTKHVAPRNFYGVGGIRIFRDLIYEMRGMMRADHKFFKKHGYYDFPQKRKGRTVAMYLAGSLFANEKLLKKMGNKINEGMLMPYDKLFKKLEKESKK